MAFVLAFGESLAFVSLLLPATTILIAMGAVLAAAEAAFWPVWAAASVGAVAGDWVSYWIGYRYREAVGTVWPFSTRPELLRKGRVVFEKWGVLGVFVSRFFGPLRSVMPLVAGMCEMPLVPFLAANIASALLWAAGVLASGTLATRWLLL